MSGYPSASDTQCCLARGMTVQYCSHVHRSWLVSDVSGVRVPSVVMRKLRCSCHRTSMQSPNCLLIACRQGELPCTVL